MYCSRSSKDCFCLVTFCINSAISIVTVSMLLTSFVDFGRELHTNHSIATVTGYNIQKVLYCSEYVLDPNPDTPWAGYIKYTYKYDNGKTMNITSSPIKVCATYKDDTLKRAKELYPIGKTFDLWYFKTDPINSVYYNPISGYYTFIVGLSMLGFNVVVYILLCIYACRKDSNNDRYGMV